MKFRSALYAIGFVNIVTFLFCEFFVYYLVLAQCKWPESEDVTLKGLQPVRAMLLADTHLLGPFRGHWWDKLRREWQMHRAFQSAIHIFYPETVFFLGDLFDEGQWVNRRDFNQYVQRFRQLFHTPNDIKIVGAVGNHDVGFHYRLNPIVVDRFDKAFNHSAVTMQTIKDVHFITINSMAMNDDGCYFCESAKKKLDEIRNLLECSKNIAKCKRLDGKKLVRYSRPIVLQHFPTYRRSDVTCIEGDIPAPENYRENWEVLSKDSTDYIGKILNPRLFFSGHSHHYCKTKTQTGVDEYTIASFSWRNKNNPSFLLAMFTPDSYAVSICYMPQETTVIRIYGFAVFLNLLILTYYASKGRKQKSE